MKVITLQSGSSGNCIYVETDVVRLLVDAGIAGRQAEQRLAAAGRDIRDVDALLISHDHADHSRCLGIYQRKFGLPIYITPQTLATVRRRSRQGELADVRSFAAGATIRFGSVTVETVPTPHDGVDGVAFIVDDGQRRLGILTDLGYAFDGLDEVMRSLDAVILESSYDPDMLAAGPYPERLKQRIRGPGGHLSNVESAELLDATANGRLQWACLAHLSERNNEPSLAMATHKRILGRRVDLRVADRYQASACWEV